MISVLRARCFRAALFLALLLPLAPSLVFAQDHGGHAEHGSAAQTKASGDPYLLETDAVSGRSLGPVAKQVLVVHELREFRFATQENADAFKAAPAKFIPAVDTKLIAQQMPFYPLDVCVVSGDKLDKETTFDFVYLNRLVRVSSKDHMATFLGEPAKYIAKLDAAVIEKQKPKYASSTCLVSDEKLGDMGDPIDHVVGHRLVRLCCKGCLKDLRADPLSYLAKLDSVGHTDDSKSGADKAKGYTCPMHKDVVSDKPGRCPKCGMDLVKKK